MNGPNAADTRLGTVLPFSGPDAFQEVTAGLKPAAGGSFTQAVDPKYVSLLTAISCTLDTEATAGNRILTVRLLDQDGVLIGLTVPPQSFVASKSILVSAFVGSGMTAYSGNDEAQMCLPPVLLFGGYSVKLNLAQPKAADQISNVRMTWMRYVEAWPDSPQPGEGRVSPA